MQPRFFIQMTTAYKQRLIFSNGISLDIKATVQGGLDPAVDDQQNECNGIGIQKSSTLTWNGV